MAKLRVLLVDDHSVVREGLKSLIETDPGLKVVGEAADAPAALKHCKELDPNVVIVDITLPGMNGIELTKQLLREDPKRRVLALTVHESGVYLQSMLKAGAAGYVLKRTAANELLDAIQQVANGGQYRDPAMAEAVDGPTDGHDGNNARVNGADLSHREAEVLQGIARGYSNKEIANRLGVSVKT